MLFFSAVLKMFDCLLVPTVSVTQLLERISEVAEQNRLFTSESPGLGQELETLQQHLESLSSTPLPPDCNFNNSQGLMYSTNFFFQGSVTIGVVLQRFALVVHCVT